MKWWEGGLEKWGWSDREILGIELEMSRSNWEMIKGNSPCVERIGCMREMGLSVWREGDGGARCVDWSLELDVWIGAWRALCASSACERANKKCLKWKWELKWFSAPEFLFYDQTENIFSLTQFSRPTK